MNSEKKSLVEEALLQMKNLENVVSENAKGILASTMKEEIEELVKESLFEGTDEEMMADESYNTEGTHMSMYEDEDEDSATNETEGAAASSELESIETALAAVKIEG